MIKRLQVLVVCIFISISYAMSQGGLGNIIGYVKDGDKGNAPVDFATVTIKQGPNAKAVVYTDETGKYEIRSLEPGHYDIVINDNSHPEYVITDFIVKSDQTTYPSDAILQSKTLTTVVVKARKKLIEKDGSEKRTISREEINELPVRSPDEMVKTQPGVIEDEGTGGLSIRGSRPEDNYFYIDGVKVRGSSNIPKGAIEEISVFVSGLPASYGDATGGVISVTTRGPSSTYFGSIEGVSSGFRIKGKDKLGYDDNVVGLDRYGYNLVEGLLAGPLWMQKDSTGKKTKPRLGFLVTAMYNDMIDSRPMANGGNYRVKRDVRDRLLADPLRTDANGMGTYSNASFLNKDDFERVPWRMNAQRRVISGTGKLDVATGPKTNLSFGASLNYNEGSSYSYSNSLFNFNNFGHDQQLDWRVYGRFTQRFINNTKGAKIRSFVYTLMVDYSQTRIKQYDPKHKFNLFDYGHVGTFVIDRVPSYELNYQDQAAVQNGFRDVQVHFTPSKVNPDLAAYTQQYYNLYAGVPEGHFENLTQIRQNNGLRNGDVLRRRVSGDYQHAAG